MLLRMETLHPRLKLLIGLLFITLGLLALVTPLTPGSWLVFVGLEFIGIRILAWRRFVEWGRRCMGKGSAAEDDELKS